ncbi:uncharacterized protein LOC112556029 [Pomacea canaliculata]|uniref:uncharacterized protein LOC112556029 n=1 Tax=Pomacea canaliculata TaxID=400727 RepID=UPI000D737647|nr:uncharacterized protein LOC112556029 [Pomacea canaliculata]
MAGVQLFTTLLLMTVAMVTIATALPSGHKLLDNLSQDSAARLVGHRRVTREVPRLSIDLSLGTLANAMRKQELADDLEDLELMKQIGKRNFAEPASSNALRLRNSDDVSAEEDAFSKYFVNILKNRLREI